jgi:hypothetical protein
MDPKTFWRIIDAYVTEDKADAPYGYAEYAERLGEMSPAELVEYASAMRRELNAAHSWDMWGAAYLICGGCSDDGFAYFCGWLLAQGSDIFLQAVEHPDSLAEYLVHYEGDDVFEDEDILSVALTTYEEKTGGFEGFELTVKPAAEPAGEQWDIEEEGELEARLPKLFAYLVAEDGAREEDDEEGEEEEL